MDFVKFVAFRLTIKCRSLSVKICIGQSNKTKTSDKQMHVRFFDDSFYSKISSDKHERRSDRLIRVRSVVNVST